MKNPIKINPIPVFTFSVNILVLNSMSRYEYQQIK